jgi:hypothetical protein
MRLIDIADRILPQKFVEALYISHGKDVGNEISYSVALGFPYGFEGIVDRLVFFEALYIRKGFKPIPLKRFVEAGGYKKDLGDVISLQLSEGEEPIRYAKMYRQDGFKFEEGR